MSAEMRNEAHGAETAGGSEGPSANVVGVLCAVAAALAFTLNDVAIKWLSGDYPLHQIIFLRSLVAVLLTLAVLAPTRSARRKLRTRRLRFHVMRGFIVVIANMAFYAGLATLPLGEATAIYFVAPLFITALSIVYLGEHVGPRRWFAVLAGLAGVYLIIRPGSASFQYAALLPLLGAFAYACLQITTRKAGIAEPASTLAFYLQVSFVIFGGAMGLVFGDGSFGDTGSANLDFLLRAWIWPSPLDALVILALGVGICIAGYLITRAYHLAEAGLLAPFEYVAMPLAVGLSVLIWGDWPDALSWTGIATIVGSGLYVFYRETKLGRRTAWKRPLPRGK